MLLAVSRSAEDTAQNGPEAIIIARLVALVALVTITGVLLITLVITLHKALTKSLR